jgi:hypothetical protein
VATRPTKNILKVRIRIEENTMCYNCGCKKPDDDHGNPKNITNRTFNEAANAAKQSKDDARKNTLELLQEVVNAPTK